LVKVFMCILLKSMLGGHPRRAVAIHQVQPCAIEFPSRI
jgi:hypothetical protein